MSRLDTVYALENIQIYRDLSHIRQRPGMYIGNTAEQGLCNLFFELIHNAVDEFSARPLNRVLIDFFPDGSCRVQDDGRGIPLEHEESHFTQFRSPGWSKDAKFRSEGGLRGIGLRAVNALSRRLRVEIARAGQLWLMEFERGEATRPRSAIKPTQETGTSVTFWPDPEIFASLPRFDLPGILDRLTEFAVLYPGLRFEVSDQRCTPLYQREICFPRGLTQRVKELNQTRGAVHPTVFYCQERADNHEVEIALQWSLADAEILYCFVNNERTRRYGIPEIGFHRSLSATLGRFGRATGLLPNQGVSGATIRAGLTAILSVKVRTALARRHEIAYWESRSSELRRNQHEQEPRRVPLRTPQ